MNFKCCLFKLKKDQLSSYYIKSLNDEPNNNDNGDEFTNLNENSKLNANFISRQNEMENDVNKESDNMKENLTKQKISFDKDESVNLQDNLEDNKGEIDEKMDFIDNLPILFSNENNMNNRHKIFNQMNISSETQSSLNFGSVSSTNQVSSYPAYYELKIRLNSGKNLAIRDVGGSSDPYAKFLLNGVNVYKSKIIFKNLNPEWNEEFSIKLSPSVAMNTNLIKSANSLQSLSQTSENNTITEPLDSFITRFKLKMFIYDYDRGFLSDDLIGYANIDLDCLKENTEESVELELEDEKLSKNEYLGLIKLDLMIIPKFATEEKEKKETIASGKMSLSASTPVILRNKRAPYQLWQCVLNVILVECNNLLSMDDNGFSDPYVKFRLENERYRSKTIRKNLNPRFLEQFQLYVYDTNKMVLNISVYDYDSSSNSDDFIGKASINLKNLDIEKTNFVKLPLEDGAGTITLLLTVTGIYDPSIIADNSNYNDRISNPTYKQEIINKYSLINSFKNINDIGWLKVKVLRAEGLASADINGKSDPFCCLQLINDYVQTYTVYKTLNPEWGQVFEFKVTDLHSVLDVTVLDEDKNKVYEFLGKIQIPLVNIQNGKKKLYALKDKKLLTKTKGVIELEMELVYNPIKAVLKTFNPRDEKLITQEPKLKVPVLKQNILRVHNIVQGLINTGNFIDSCFRWIHPLRSLIAFISFILIVLNFETYMLPLTLLMLFLKNYLIIQIKSYNTNQEEEDLNFDFTDEEEDTADPESKEPKKSFRERLNEIQEICLKVQETLDYIASLGERVINTFVFTNPWLSWLAIIVLVIVSLILYLVPLRFLILIWGINKFTKKFRKPPDFVDNTEILDFLSRIPSKKELFQYKEFRVEKISPNNSLIATNNYSKNNNNNKKKKS